MRLRLEAYAKLNLALRVLYRRDDGFHEIDSLVQRIDLCDRLTVERTKGEIEVFNDASIEGIDIAERAARALARAKNLRDGFRITIEKQTPIGAGLGGGSSDAAAVLHAIDRLTPPELDDDALRAIAAGIGSDVPLFLKGGLLRMTGRGENTERLDGTGAEHYVVVVPPVHCATAAVYGAWRETGASSSERNLARGENDLMPAALSVYPELALYRDAVRSLDAAYWGMSGSGSSFYAAVEDKKHAREEADRAAKAVPNALVFACRAVDVGCRVMEAES